jgi:putative ABC transport system permease protein
MMHSVQGLRRAFGFAWRSLVRQPARGGLAVLGVAAIGALLFDMLMLSQGLITSMRDLLDRTGWDVRAVAGGDLPGTELSIAGGVETAAAIAALPSVRTALALRTVRVAVLIDGGSVQALLAGVTSGPRPPWTVIRGRDAEADADVVINQQLSADAHIEVGRQLTIQARCLDTRQSLPTVTVAVVGIAEFPLDASWEYSIAGTLDGLVHACGGDGRGDADTILVASTDDPQAAARAIGSAFPDLRVRTNDEAIARFQQNGFSYFRQISTVLTTVTLAFALLLISVLLTVSVNQRLGEIAALRALGLSQWRVISDVLAESTLIVGCGGALSLPLGLLLARGLDRILLAIPGLPAGLHFFVFQPDALLTHVTLLVITALAAALYPMRIVARLPIAATLRAEVGG